jgi:hypothetical protein
MLLFEFGIAGHQSAIPNSECSQRYKRLDVFTGKGFAMKIANYTEHGHKLRILKIRDNIVKIEKVVKRLRND